MYKSTKKHDNTGELGDVCMSGLKSFDQYSCKWVSHQHAHSRFINKLERPSVSAEIQCVERDPI